MVGEFLPSESPVLDCAREPSPRILYTQVYQLSVAVIPAAEREKEFTKQDQSSLYSSTCFDYHRACATE